MSTLNNIKNFDFGAHWYSHIAPLLQTDEMKQLLKLTYDRSRQRVKEEGYSVIDKKENDAPAFITVDGVELWIEAGEAIISTMVQANDKRIPEELLQEYNKIDDYIDECRIIGHYPEDYHRIADKEQVQNKIADYIGLNYEKDPTNIVHWVIYGHNGLFNRFIGMYLARKLFGDTVHWRFIRGKHHSTIISSDGTKMFDFPMWATDGLDVDRIYHFCCGFDYDDPDPSLGAKASVEALVQDERARISTIIQRSTPIIA